MTGETTVEATVGAIKPGHCYKFWDAEAEECTKCILDKDCKRMTLQNKSGQVEEVKEEPETKETEVKVAEQTVEKSVEQPIPKKRGRPRKIDTDAKEEPTKAPELVSQPVEKKEEPKEEPKVEKKELESPCELLWHLIEQEKPFTLVQGQSIDTRILKEDEKAIMVFAKTTSGKVKVTKGDKVAVFEKVNTIEEAESTAKKILKFLS